MTEIDALEIGAADGDALVAKLEEIETIEGFLGSFWEYVDWRLGSHVDERRMARLKRAFYKGAASQPTAELKLVYGVGEFCLAAAAEVEREDLEGFLIWAFGEREQGINGVVSQLLVVLQADRQVLSLWESCVQGTRQRLEAADEALFGRAREVAPEAAEAIDVFMLEARVAAEDGDGEHVRTCSVTARDIANAILRLDAEVRPRQVRERAPS